MTKFIAYELKKLAGVRYLQVILVLMLAANCVLAWYQVPSDNGYSDILSRFFDMYSDDPEEITKGYNEYREIQDANTALRHEAISKGDYDFKLPDVPNKLALADEAGTVDGALYSALFNKIDYIDSYPDTIDRVIKRAEANLREFEAMGVTPESYAYKYQLKVIDLYRIAMNTVEMELEPTRGWDYYFNYTAVNVFIFAFVLMLCTVIFAQEKATGFMPIIRTARYGRSKTAFAKLIAAAIVTIVSTLLFIATTMAVIGVRTGFSSTGNAIQIFERYTLFPYVVSVGEYFFISIIVKLAVYLVFAAVVLLFSVLLYNYALIYMSGLGFFALNYLFSTLSIIGAENPFKTLNLVSAASVDPIFVRYRSIGILDNVIGFVPLMTAVYLLITVGACAFAVYRFAHGGNGVSLRFISGIAGTLKAPFAKKERAELAAPKKKIVKHHVRTRSLFLTECYKTLISSRFIIVIALLLAARCYLSYGSGDLRRSYQDSVYKEYMTTLAGPFTDEKRVYIDEERDRIASIMAQKDSMQVKYANEEITFEEYHEYLAEYNDAYGRKSVFELVEEKAHYIDMLAERGTEAHFVYDTHWNRVFSRDFDFILYAAILILFAGGFAGEYSSRSSQGGFYAILSSTKRGRGPTFCAKLISCAAVSVAISLAFALSDLLLLTRDMSLPLAASPAQSLRTFAFMQGKCTITQAIILKEAFTVIGSLILGFITSALSCLTKKVLPTLSGTVAITLFPALFVSFGVEFFKYTDLLSMMQGTNLMTLSGGITGSLAFAVIFTAIAFALCAVMTIFAAKRFKVR